MTTISLSDMQSLVLSKVGNKLEDADVAPGNVPFDFVVHIKGSLSRGEDTEKTPTSRALTLETMALFIHRMGIQREKALEILVDVMMDNVIREESTKEALMEVTGVKAAKERLATEMAKLPKTPVKGQVRLSLDVVEAVTESLPGEGKAVMPK